MRGCCRGRARKVPDGNKGGKEKRQVGVVDHVEIGDGVIVGAQAGMTRDIPPRSTVLGAPAVPHTEFKRQLAALARLGKQGEGKG